MNYKLKLFLENSLYLDNKEKDNLLSKPKKMYAAFWINFLGSVGIYITKGASNNLIKQYFKSDGKLRIDSITDQNNDASVLLPEIAKVLDKSVINKMTRFLQKLKLGQDIDEAIFKDQLFDIVYIKLKKFPNLTKIKQALDGYYNGSISLLDFVRVSIVVSRSHNYCKEFRTLARKAKVKINDDPAPLNVLKTTQPQQNVNISQVGIVNDPKPIIKEEWELYIETLISTSKYKEVFESLKNNIKDNKNFNVKDVDIASWLAYLPTIDKDKFKKVKINLRITSGFTTVLPLVWYLNPESINDSMHYSKYIIEILEATKIQSAYIQPAMVHLKFENKEVSKQIYDIFVNRKTTLQNWILKNIFLVNLYKIEDSWFKKIIENLINSNPNYLDEIKAIMTPELERKLKSNGLFDLFNKKINIQFNTSEINHIIDMMFDSTDLNAAFENLRRTKYPDVTLDQLKEAILNVAISNITIDIDPRYWYIDEPLKIYLYFNKDNRILKILNKARNYFGKLTFFIAVLDPKFYDEDANLQIFEKFLKRNIYDLSSYGKSYNNLEEIGYSYDFANKIFNLLINDNVWFLEKKYVTYDFFGKNYFIKLIQDNLDVLIYRLNGGTGFRLLLAILKIIAKYLSDEQIKKINDAVVEEASSQTSIWSNILIHTGKEELESIDKILKNFDTDLIIKGIETQNLRSGAIKVALKSFDIENDDIYKYENVKNYINKLFEKRPDLFKDYYSENVENRNLKEDFFKDLSEEKYQNIISSIKFDRSSSLDGKDLILINDVNDVNKKNDLFKNWLVNFKQKVNASLKRGGVLPSVNDFLFDSYQKDPNSIDLMLESVDENIKNQLFNEIRRFVMVAPMLSNIHTSHVVPQKKLSAEDIKNALKFNNFDVEEVSKVRKLKKEKYSETLTRSIKLAENLTSLPEQQIKKVEISDGELAKKTYDFNKKYHAGKHGDIGAQFIEEFDVNLTMGDWEGFRKTYGKEGILNPAFHGTNGTAASMILRFGFAILTAKELEKAGGKYAGSMLGPGIYSAPNLDKITNYIGDSNYGKLGSVGYVFEMDETLGILNKHYRAAGLSASDGIRSPEFCAKYPRDQIKILKCYKAVKSSLKHISNNAKKHNVKIDEQFEKQIWGDNILNEQESITGTGWTTFIFMEDLIPVSKSNAKPIDDVKLKRSKDVVISQWQDGIEINIKNNTKNYDMYKIHDTFEALKNKNVIITKFLSAIKKYMI